MDAILDGLVKNSLGRGFVCGVLKQEGEVR